jgi:microcystin-dependent protein
MAQPFIGEIRMFGGNFAPVGWNFCDGTLLDISQYPDLFQLIGTTYGGDGQKTFSLPDLRGRIPVHVGGIYQLGQMAGVETVTLTAPQLPTHSHNFMGSGDVANSPNPQGNVAARSGQVNMFVNADASIPMDPNAIGITGGSESHDNFQPYLCITFIISLYGIFPPPSK